MSYLTKLTKPQILISNEKIICEIRIGDNVKGSELLDYASCSEDSAVTQWRIQEFCSRGEGGSSNSVEDRENRDLGAVAP